MPHQEVVQAMAAEPGGTEGRDAVSCIRCHNSVGHLESASMGTAGP